MRGLSVAVLATAILLAGCSGSGGLHSYLMQPAEVPEGCQLLPLDSDQGRSLQEQFNWTGNPGSVDNQVFGSENVVGNRVAIYECGDDDIASLVLQFATNEDADEYAGGDTGFCDIDEKYGYGEVGVVAGNLVAFVEGDTGVPGMVESLQRWMQRVSSQAGVPNPCTDESADESH